jgi:hypothetical protein
VPAATKSRKKTTEKSLIDALADYQRSKKTKRRTIARVVVRRLLNKKTRGATLAVLVAAGVALCVLARPYLPLALAGVLAFLVLCEAWPEIVKWGALNRRMLVPFAALTLMAAPAALAWRSPYGAAFLGLAGLVFVFYSHANLRARAREHSHAAGYIPRSWLPMAYLAAAWTVAAARFGVGQRTLAVLLAAWVVWAVRFWFVNRSRTVGQQLPLAQRWADTIANNDYDHIAPNHKLVGSRLIGVRSVPGGMAATVVLPEGQRGSKVDALVETIASIYNVDITDVTVDQSTAANRRELFVLPRSPLRKPHTWKGPDVDRATWTSTIGTYIDGTRVEYIWCVPGSGPWHDLISGTTRSGKSRLLDLLLAESRNTGGYMVDWVIDPQNGQSLPDWQDEVDWFASGVDEGMRMLRAAKAVMYARNRFLSKVPWTDERGKAKRGVKGFTPGIEGLPQLNITIDEAHAILADKEAVAIVEELGKMGSKCGIKLRLVTQVPTLSQLGNSNVIRSMVASGNVIVLRTGGKSDGQFAFQGALVVDPVSIPRRMPDGSSSAGLGFSLGSESRQAPMRLDWAENPLDYTEGVPVWHLPADETKHAGLDYARFRAGLAEDADVIEGEVVSETFGDPQATEATTPEGVVVRGPGGITCADRAIQIVKAEANRADDPHASVSRSKVAEQLLGTWKLQMVTKTIKELCLDPNRPVWSDDQRTTLYYKEAS